MGLGLAFVTDMAAGMAGNALEQQISRGSVNLRESVTSGLINAAGGAIYGNEAVKTAGEALLRGAGAGAAASGIQYISDALGGGKGSVAGRRGPSGYGKGTPGTGQPYGGGRDPRGNCGGPEVFSGSLDCGTARGYTYRAPEPGEGNGGGSGDGAFSLTGFGKALLTGGLTGGLGSLMFFGAGKAVEGLKGSLARRKGGASLQTINNKFPNDNQVGKTFNYTIENGKIKIHNGIQNVDFVIDMDNNLHIGRGHSYLAGGQNVQAAGTMKVNSQGYIRNITNESGHYQPTVASALNYPEIFKKSGLNVNNAWIKISDIKTSMSNYVIDKSVFYNGPIKYIPY